MNVPSIKQAEYAGKFPDGTPQKWSVDKRAAAWIISFPNGADVSATVPVESHFWDMDFSSDFASSTLWLRSLCYLPMLKEDGYRNWSDIDTIATSFTVWLESRLSHLDTLVSGSLDHQLALRLRTACTLKSLLHSDERCNVDRAKVAVTLSRMVAADAAVLDALDLFKDNNHGIMLALGVLHASVFFPDRFDSSATADWFTKLSSSLSRLIDADGYAPENTVSYQIFYVSLLDQIVDFALWAELELDGVAALKALRDKAVLATGRLLLPNGAVPPIGDSPGGMQRRFRHVSGRVFSPSNGFFVKSTEKTYLSLKAGYRSVIHKQMDDSSVILWHDGCFILRDAGLLSYDSNDPAAMRIRGQQGHSSTVLKRYDALNASKAVSYSKNTSRVLGRLKLGEGDDLDVDVFAIVKYDGVDGVRRRVSSYDMSEFVIVDEFLGKLGEEYVTRFILDESVREFGLRDGCLEFKAGDTWVSVEAHRLTSEDVRVPARIDIRETVIATAPYVRTPCHYLRIDSSPKMSGERLITRVSLAADRPH